MTFKTGVLFIFLFFAGIVPFHAQTVSIEEKKTTHSIELRREAAQRKKMGTIRRIGRELRRETAQRKKMGLPVGLTMEQIFRNMNLECIPVDGLSVKKISGNKPLRWEPYSSMGCCHVQSNDKRFISVAEIQFPLDIKTFDRAPNTITFRNRRYFSTIREDLIEIAKKYDTNYRDKFTLNDLKKNVYYYPDEYTKRVFNADTAISYSLPIKRVGLNSNVKWKYTNCEVLMIHKNDLGPIFFYSFFTKKGYKNRQEYLEKLEKSIKFKN